VQREHPEVLFLAEAFTRPKRMRWLAKAGFSQSYTYFTWRNTAAEVKEYFTELTQGQMKEYFRGNFFINTPDILHEFLQKGGRPAFRIRLMLAATLAPTYGIYAGFELGENVPLRPGSEEYLDSEKYELKHRDWTAEGSLGAEITRLNRLRREHPALQRYDNLSFHPCSNAQILFYLKRAVGPVGDILVAVTCDYAAPQEGFVEVPLELLGIKPDEVYLVEDMLTGARYEWRGSKNYVRLDPAQQPGHMLRLVRNYIDVEVT
jgi:starch synthase (maltosyl-transferring)